MSVKIQRPITFNNKCGCIVDYKELEKAILWKQNTLTNSIRAISLVVGYSVVTIANKHFRVHRLLMEYWTQAPISKGFIVHHLDENKLNCVRSNLIIMDAAAHMSLHSTGRTHSPETKLKLATAGHRRKGIRLKKRIDIPLDVLHKKLCVGESISSIARHFNCNWNTIKYRTLEYPWVLGKG